MSLLICVVGRMVERAVWRLNRFDAWLHSLHHMKS